jgi:hypothetical protein
VGTYAWIASYGGDTDNVAISSTCGAESVVISPPPPPSEGNFQFTKTVTGNLTGWTGGQFPFTVSCGGSTTIVTLNVSSTGATVSSQIFGPYVAGTVCSVTEGTLPAAGTYASWVNSPTYSPTSGSATIVSDQTVTVSVTNTRSYSPPPNTGQLTITKDVVGAPVGWTGTFTFSVTCTAPTFSQTGVTIDTASGDTATVSGIPLSGGTNSCVVAETGTAAPPTGYSAWVTGYSTAGGAVTVTTAGGQETVTNTTGQEAVEGATATPAPTNVVKGVTAPPTSTGSSGSSNSSTPLFALLICFAFGGLGLAAVEAQRRTVRR